MSKITTSAGLKKEIQKLEEELVENQKILKDHFKVTYELFKPVNLIGNVLKKFISPSFLINKLIGPALGLVTGYLFRK
jgi:hypothetical protein